MSCTHHYIEHLVYQYASAIDRGDFDTLGALFSQGSIIYMPGSWQIKGAKNVVNHFSKTVKIYPETGTPCTMHQVTNIDVVIDDSGKRATANAVFVVHQAVPDEPIKLICTGRYFDRFNFDGTHWYFSERRVMPEYFGDLSQHIYEEQDLSVLKSV